MIAESVRHLDEITLRRHPPAIGKYVSAPSTKSPSWLVGKPWAHILHDAHRLQCAEHIRRTVNQLGPAARQRRRLKAAAKFFRFLVKRAHAHLRMRRFEPRYLFLQQLISRPAATDARS